MYSDYHVHSNFSFDSDAKPSNMIDEAIKKNMPQICFTEHQDFNWPIKNESPLVDMDLYFSTMQQLKDQYKGKIQILVGLEMGMSETCSKQCETLLSKYNFDFVIASLHLVDGMDPYYPDFWQGIDNYTAFRKYFRGILELLPKFSFADTLGHMDYIARYSHQKENGYKVEDYIDLIDEILKFLISHDMKLEVNTASLYHDLNFCHPHPDILIRYRELGGKFVTIGSDAHDPKHIGYAFEKTSKMLRDIGLKIYTR